MIANVDKIKPKMYKSIEDLDRCLNDLKELRDSKSSENVRGSSHVTFLEPN